MAIMVIFALGVANFALHKAVLESGHSLFARLPRAAGGFGRKAMLATEFLILVVAMLLAANSWPSLAWAYLIYTCANAGTAWLILTGRV